VYIHQLVESQFAGDRIHRLVENQTHQGEAQSHFLSVEKRYTLLWLMPHHCHIKEQLRC